MTRRGPVRYAVVGLGHIAQVAVLPAFRHAANSRLAALVSGDRAKRRELSKQYRVPAFDYASYDACLRSGAIDAVYIALPNAMHRDYAVQAADAGIHVLCEKPMAVTEDECRDMIEAAETNRVKLMIAYRLHFEAANLHAVAQIRRGALGEPRAFQSLFTEQVRAGDIRLDRELGGGTLYDIGIYCINAARYLFRSEPYEVCAFSAKKAGRRFQEVDETTSAVLRFPGERLATFTSSFGAADVSRYSVVGTRGELRVEPAFDYRGRLAHHLTVGGRTRSRTFAERDQFAPELVYFSKCIQRNLAPEPSGTEGLADVRIIRALYRSAASGGQPVRLDPVAPAKRPSLAQQITRPPVDKPRLVRTESPTFA